MIMKQPTRIQCPKDVTFYVGTFTIQYFSTRVFLRVCVTAENERRVSGFESITRHVHSNC